MTGYFKEHMPRESSQLPNRLRPTMYHGVTGGARRRTHVPTSQSSSTVTQAMLSGPQLQMSMAEVVDTLNRVQACLNDQNQQLSTLRQSVQEPLWWSAV